MSNQEYSEVVLPFIAKSWDLSNPNVKHDEIICFIDMIEDLISSEGLDDKLGLFNLIQIYHQVNLN